MSFDLKRFLAAFDPVNPLRVEPEPRRRARSLTGLPGPLLDEILAVSEPARSRALHLLLETQLLDEGVDAEQASRAALRQARLFVYVLELRYSQREAAVELGVHERTAKLDAVRLRSVLPRLRETAARPDLSPVRVPDGNRVRAAARRPTGQHGRSSAR